MSKRKTVLVYSFVFFTSIALYGCSGKASLKGEAFIVTEGRENIEIGLMEVKAYKASNIEEHLKRRHKKSKSESEEIIKNISNELDSLHNTSERLIDFKKIDETRMDTRERFDYEEKLSDLTLEVEYDQIDVEAAIDNLQEVRGQEFYLKNAPKPYKSVKTGSDGGFEISLSEGQKYYIVASADRETSNSTEEYFWMEKINLSRMDKNEIILSNDKLNGVARHSKSLSEERMEVIEGTLIEMAKDGIDVDYNKAVRGLFYPKDYGGVQNGKIDKYLEN